VPSSPLRRLLPLLALAAAGCAARPARFVNVNADLSAVKTVAVLPFENVTADKLCSERVQRLFLTELLATAVFEVVEPGLVIRAVRRDQLDVSALSADEIRKLGQALKADALFVGTVLEYDEGRGGAILSPQVKLQFRLVDAATAATLWSVTRSAGGATVSARLFGVGSVGASSLAEQLIREEVSRFRR
jgi:hypothetical protein